MGLLRRQPGRRVQTATATPDKQAEEAKARRRQRWENEACWRILLST
jgi:hypothetical protein